MDSVINRIGTFGLVPVVVIDDAKDAVALAKALIDGGLPIAEVTFRTDAAESAIAKITAAYPDMIIGAGTVVTKDHVDRAVAAGAQFIVSPGFDPNIVKYAQSKNVCIVPGTATPGEMAQAMALGLTAVKFFPAEQNGGLAALKAISAAYGNLKFFPTGGISAKNIADYISFEKILACGGSWMVPKSLIKEGKFDEITILVKEAVAAMLGFKFVHVGVNTPGEDAALDFAQWLAKTFNFDFNAGNSSIFAGDDCFEIMKRMGRGSMGHIAVQTNSLPRAIAHLKSRGYELDEENAFYKDGKMIALYLQEERAGFAFHLTQK